MLPTPQTPQERQKHEEFYRAQIKKTWNIIDTAGQGHVDKREISYIMRYLMQFPSEMQVRDVIIVKLEDDEPSEYIKFEKFQEYMVGVLMTNDFAVATPEQLLAAFRALDPLGTGRIKKEIIQDLLTTKGIPLRKQECEPFLQFALDKTGNFIEYEDYVHKLNDENERHLELLLKDFDEFMKK